MKRKWLIFALFIFSHDFISILSPAQLESRQAYKTSEECIKVARLLQGARLAPFFYCVGDLSVDSLPLRELPRRER